MSLLHAFGDRCRTALSVSGTGSLYVCESYENKFVDGYQAVYNTIGTDVPFYYTLVSRSNGQWEVGSGYLIDAAGSIYLVRERVLTSTNNNDTVDFFSDTIDLFATVPNAALETFQHGYSNVLINSEFREFQRQVATTKTSRSDGQYGPDRFYILTQTGAIGCEQVTGSKNEFAVKLTQDQATAQRFGFASVVTKSDCYHLRGKTIIYQGIVKASASQAIRYAIVEWTGTADSPTKDIINSWTSTSYTAGNFFLGSNLTIVNTGSITPSASTVTDFEIRGELSSSLNNLYVIVWTEGTAAQNFTLEFEELAVYLGSERRLFVPLPSVLTKNLCLPYCQVITKTSLPGYRSLTNNMLFYVDFPAGFRKSPTFSHNVTGYSAGFTPAVTEFSGYNVTAAANVTISGGFTLTADGWTANKMRLVATAGTSFSGSAGDNVAGALGNDVRLIFDADL